MNILVIKHGALGDIIMATGAMKAIRAQFPVAHITLLTTKPYATLMAQSPFFDEIWVDSKPKITNREGVRKLKAMLNSKRWDWVFDLQNSGRTTLYPWLFKRPWPKMSGASRWISHPRGKYDITKHALVNIQHQMTLAGIDAGAPDIRWMQADVSGFALPQRYALLVAGCSPQHPGKRWPGEQYASLAMELAAKGITPVLIGTAAEEEVLRDIAARVPHTINLCGRTSIPQIAELARGATVAVGNDTGPMHIIGATGCPGTAIFSFQSDPARMAPVGNTTVLRERDLSQLSVDRVLVSLRLPQ